MRTGGRRPPPAAVVALSAAVVVVLVLDGVVIGQAARSGRAPAFSEGGDFVSGPPAIASTAPPATPPTSLPPTTSALRTSTSSTTVAASTTTTAVEAPSPPEALGPPAAGSYTFAVEGSEAASIVGSRAFEPTLTVVVHGAAGLGADQVVLDYTFSTQHEEREIAFYGPDGVALTHEAGSITFGLVTESSDVSFHPPMGQVPFPRVPGAVRSGASTVRSPNGSVVRVDDWETRVVGNETLTVGGRPVETSRVQFTRRSRPGAEVITQHMTLWFDPVRRMAVKIQDEIHADRIKGILTLTYDARDTATLA